MQKLSDEMAVEIAERYLRCQQRLSNCYQDCSKCHNNYTESELRRCVYTLLKAKKAEKR